MTLQIPTTTVPIPYSTGNYSSLNAPYNQEMINMARRLGELEATQNLRNNASNIELAELFTNSLAANPFLARQALARQMTPLAALGAATSPIAEAEALNTPVSVASLSLQETNNLNRMMLQQMMSTQNMILQEQIQMQMKINELEQGGMMGQGYHRGFFGRFIWSP